MNAKDAGPGEGGGLEGAFYPRPPREIKFYVVCLTRSRPILSSAAGLAILEFVLERESGSGSI